MKKEIRIEEYKSWVLEHEKYPSPTSDDKTERSLGNWRNTYRKRKFKSLLDFDKEVNFNSPKSPEKRFTEDYIPWVLKYKKYPSLITPKDKIEKSLGIWRFANRRKNFKPLLDFDEKVNFRSCKSSEERFIGEYIPWVLEHEKYPSLTSKDGIEKSLGRWRFANRRKNFKLLLDFDEKVNFKSNKSPEERFTEDYIPWVLKYKKYPSAFSEDKVEKSLGRWRYKQRFENFEQLKNFDIFYSSYLIGNVKAIEIFNELKEKGII